MSHTKRERQSRRERAESDYVRGGKGRRDEVGKTGIHPASAGTAPEGAPVRGQEELGHTSPHGEALQEVPNKSDNED